MTRSVRRRFPWLAVVLIASGCNSRSPANAPLAADYWESISVLGSKVGFAHTKVTPIEENGQTLLRVDVLSKFTLRRGTDISTQEFRIGSVETPQGRLLRFESSSHLGAAPIDAVGKVVDHKLTVETTSSGRGQTTTLNWPDENGGFYAVERSLAVKPLQPSEKRSIKLLAPILHDVQTTEMSAGEWETVQLPGGEQKLLRIEAMDMLPGDARLKWTGWANAEGEIFKRVISLMQMEIVRTSRADALAAADAVSLDLLGDLIVPIAPPLLRPHETRKVRYHVKLAGGDPRQAFSHGPTQKVTSTGPTEADINVVSLRPGEVFDLTAGESGRPVEDADRLPSTLVESDDPFVMDLARTAAPSEAAPAQIAIALEKAVQQAITKKGYSQAFDTAGAVARSRQGDCTEHAVLLMALLRARGIPARAAMGLVYAPSEGGFAYHMWTEAFLEGVWIPLDGTLGKGGIGAAHLKIADSSLAGSSGLGSMLPVAAVIGRLEIEVVEIER